MIIMTESLVSSKITLKIFSELKGLWAILLGYSPDTTLSGRRTASMISSFEILRPCSFNMRSLFSAWLQNIIGLGIILSRVKDSIRLQKSQGLEVNGNIKLTGRIRQGSMGDVAEMMALSPLVLSNGATHQILTLVTLL